MMCSNVSGSARACIECLEVSVSQWNIWPQAESEGIEDRQSKRRWSLSWLLWTNLSKILMIWQGMCSCGAKTKVFVTNRTIYSKLYNGECLKNCILRFIKAHKGPVKFWPDLASCHYNREITQWYRDNNVHFIEKIINPLYCSQFQPRDFGK